jgi:cation:H+ antiporter
MFLYWLVAATLEARRQRSAAPEVAGIRRHGLAVVFCVLGLALLATSGYLVVAGARGIATSFGVDEFLIGATVVAIGTSTPELATTVIAMLRGHAEVALGTILGSNIFNGLFIVAIAAVITPIATDWREVAVSLVFGLAAVALTFPTRAGLIERWRGGLLLLVYAAYLAAVVGGR